MIKDGIKKLVNGITLDFQESREIMKEIMTGEATTAQTASFITALRMKGETSNEIAAFSSIMREFCCRINPKVTGRLVDTCGTGGDRIKTFNISTTAAFVVAGAGISVAKHGNRSFTSKSGSADILEELGFNLKIGPEVVKQTIENIGIGFMFAPNFHPAMKYAVSPRRDIGIRTVFNILGPLSNPANADSQLLGVYNDKLVAPLAHALAKLGSQEAMVVHGFEGLDEISTIEKTFFAWLKDEKIQTFNMAPKDFGIKQAKFQYILGGTPEENARICFEILNSDGSSDNLNAKRDIVLVNAAAGIIVGGKAEDFAKGIEIARESIDSGEAYEKLKGLIKVSNGNLSILERLETQNV